MEENFQGLLGVPQFEDFSTEEGHDVRHLLFQLPDTLSIKQDCTQEFLASLETVMSN